MPVVAEPALAEHALVDKRLPMRKTYSQRYLIGRSLLHFIQYVYNFIYYLLRVIYLAVELI